MPTCNIGTGENLFNCLDDSFSSKRKKEYKEFLEFTETDPLKIIKHCTSRWLSLQKCVGRTLQQWQALQSYFNSHGDADKKGRVRSVAKLLADSEMELYFQFLNFILAPLASFNVTFQVQFKVEENQLNDTDFNIGNEARVMIIKAGDDITLSQETRFFQSVRRFYEALTDKMVKSFPVDSMLLRDMVILAPEERETISCKAVIDMAKRFPQIVKECELDTIREKFMDYQLADQDELHAKTKIDRYWGKVSLMKAVWKARFPTLSRLMKMLLTIPHANASSERTFSIIRKIDTEFRSDLGKGTMCSLLSCKLNNDKCCHDTGLTTKVLNDCKSATWAYNQKHMKS